MTYSNHGITIMIGDFLPCFPRKEKHQLRSTSCILRVSLHHRPSDCFLLSVIKKQADGKSRHVYEIWRFKKLYNKRMESRLQNESRKTRLFSRENNVKVDLQWSILEVIVGIDTNPICTQQQLDHFSPTSRSRPM